MEDRHDRVLQIVRQEGSIRVADLASRLSISVETARRDVTALAAIGRVQRVHGSVVWPTARLNARDSRVAQVGVVAARTPVLGMVVPVASYVFHRIILGARAAADAAGASLVVGITDYQHSRDAAHIRSMLAAGVDGLMLAPSWGIDGPTTADLEELESLQRPFVLVERSIPVGASDRHFDQAIYDHSAGVAQAVRHLRSLGHGRIALLTRPTHTRSSIRSGYAATMATLGLPNDDVAATEPHKTADPDPVEVARFLDLASTRQVRAGIVHTDSDAINMLQRLAAEGIRVPEDFALVAYNDDLAGVADVALTTVAPNRQALGEAATQLLMRRLADPDADDLHIALVPALRVRESSGALASGKSNLHFPSGHQEPTG